LVRRGVTSQFGYVIALVCCNVCLGGDLISLAGTLVIAGGDMFAVREIIELAASHMPTLRADRGLTRAIVWSLVAISERRTAA
jgi:hypothetical protein